MHVLSVPFNYTWTNTTYSDWVCSKIALLGSENIAEIEIYFDESTGSALPYNERFLMPDCFWNANLSSLESVYAENTIFTGNSTAGGQADPLLRFPSNLTSLRLRDSRLVNPNVRGATYKINWTTLFDSKPLLEKLTLTSVGLEGTLPPFIPEIISRIYVESNPKFAGTIPAGLFSNHSQSEDREIKFGFSGNAITGTIPNTLFTNLKTGPTIIDFSYNALTGTIPSNLLNVSWGGYSVEIFFDGNQLTGTLPANIFGTNFWGAYNFDSSYDGAVHLSFSSNKLSGTIPETIFSGASHPIGSVSLVLSNNAFTGSIPNFFASVNSSLQIGSLAINLGGNKLSGTILPSKFWPPSSMKTRGLRWTVDHNALTGTIPENLLSDADPLMTSIALDLSGNKLTGSIQPSMISGAEFSSPISLELSFSKNSITGPLTSAIVGSASQVAGAFILDLSGNKLGGTIPTDLLSSYSSDTQTTYLLSLILADCGLTGNLPTIASDLEGLFLVFADNGLSAAPNATWANWLASALTDTSYVGLDITNNKYTGTISLPSLNVNNRLLLNADGNDFTKIEFGDEIPYLNALSIGRNRRMTGTLPESLFNGTSSTYFINVNDTSISGDLPIGDFNSDSLESLYLSSTKINFCPSDLTVRWTASLLSLCDLKKVNVTGCIDKYPGVCQYYYGRVLESPSKAPTSSAPSLATSTTFTVLFATVALILACL